MLSFTTLIKMPRSWPHPGIGLVLEAPLEFRKNLCRVGKLSLITLGIQIGDFLVEAIDANGGCILRSEFCHAIKHDLCVFIAFLDPVDGLGGSASC